MSSGRDRGAAEFTMIAVNPPALPNGPPTASGVSESRVSPRLIIVLLLLFAAVVHAPVPYGNLYGEQDSARLTIDALLWEKTGIRSVSLSEYRYFTSSGYIFFIKQMMGVPRASGIPL